MSTRVIMLLCCALLTGLGSRAARAQASDAPVDSSGADTDVGVSAANEPGRSSPAGEAVVPPSALPEHRVEIALSLDEAVRLALEHNLDLRIARVDLRASGYGVVSEQAAFDPFFTLGATYAKNREPTASFLDIGGGGLRTEVQPNPFTVSNWSAGLRGRTWIGSDYSVRIVESGFDRPLASGTLFGINPQQRASTRVDITQPLLKGAWYPYNTANLLMARNTRRISRQELELQAINLAYQVEQAYWNLMFALKNWEAAAKALEVARENLSIARRKREVGKFARIDVTITQSQETLRKVELNEAELLLENSRDTLLDLLNHKRERPLSERLRGSDSARSWDGIFVRATTTPDPRALRPDRADAIRVAFDRRPDYRQTDLRIRNQRTLMDVADNDRLPSLNLTANWEQLGLDDSVAGSFSSLGTGNFYDWALGIQLEVPIFQRGPRSRYLTARENLVKARLQRTRLENRIVLEVDQSLRDLESLERKVKDLEERVRLQDAILQAEHKKVGVGTSIDYTVSIIENDLVASQAQSLRAQADLQTAKAKYLQVTGQLLDKYGLTFGPRSVGRTPTPTPRPRADAAGREP